ncbi:protein YIPF6-like [Corticium candelabrum]|uniref:protein YIPF6-like n=1 Tax=Corticium candelabrum TaxID=121492 RepID=UPI002E270841|nr:protein YIPF6-like [Corticium candelabrum]
MSESEVEIELEGNISVPESNEEDDGTLDEPIFTTLKRDLLAIVTKCTHVIIPRRSKYLLRDWDLWGPLILCLVLAVLLHSPNTAPNSNNSDLVNSNNGPNFIDGPNFVEVFVIVWCGSAAATINSQLLGGSISFFQSLCALGYCLFPCTVVAAVSYTLKKFIFSNVLELGSFVIHIILTMFGCSWAILDLMYEIYDILMFWRRQGDRQKKQTDKQNIVSSAGSMDEAAARRREQLCIAGAVRPHRFFLCTHACRFYSDWKNKEHHVT